MLGKAKINIEALSVEVQGNRCIIDIVVKDDKKAMDLLTKNGYQVFKNDVLIVKIKDEPARMSEFSAKLAKNKINILSMSKIVDGEGYDFFAIKTDRPAKAKKVLESYLASK